MPSLGVPPADPSPFCILLLLPSETTFLIHQSVSRDCLKQCPQCWLPLARPWGHLPAWHCLVGISLSSISQSPAKGPASPSPGSIPETIKCHSTGAVCLVMVSQVPAWQQRWSWLLQLCCLHLCVHVGARVCVSQRMSMVDMHFLDMVAESPSISHAGSGVDLPA